MELKSHVFLKFALKFSIATAGFPVPWLAIGMAAPMPAAIDAIVSCVGGPFVAMTSALSSYASGKHLAKVKEGKRANGWNALAVATKLVNHGVSKTFCSVSSILHKVFKTQGDPVCPNTGLGFGASIGFGLTGFGWCVASLFEHLSSYVCVV